MNPRAAIYQEGKGRIVHVAAILSIVAFVLTLIFVWIAWTKGPSWAIAMYFGVAIWAIVPAWWFWYEYFFVYRRDGADDTFDLFKHGQQTAIAIWAGVTLSLAAVATSDHFKEPKPNPTTCARAGS